MTLATFAAELTLDALPPDVVHQAERLALDTFACSISGYTVENGQALTRVFAALGGMPDSTLIPQGTKTSAPVAALVNTQLANNLDLDDNLLYHTHFANSSVMAPLAVAEQVGAHGRELIAAIVGAFEVTARVALSLPSQLRVISPPPDLRTEWPSPFGHSYNVFGAAAGAANLLGLDAERTTYALGIGGYTTPVPTLARAMSLGRLTMMRYEPYGWMAWAGVMGAFLAQEGMTADPQVLDGPEGFWRMTGADYTREEALTAELGTKWWILDTTLKPYPAGTWCRNGMYALEQLLNRSGIGADEIDEIRVHTWIVRPGSANTQTDIQSYLDTQLSYPYLLAVTALRVPPNRWHLAEVYTDPAVGRLMRKIRLEPLFPEQVSQLYQEIERLDGRVTKNPTVVEVDAGGKTYVEHATYAKGDPFDERTRLSDGELADKFVTHTADLLGERRSKAAVDLLINLAAVDDLGKVLRAVVAHPR